MKTAIIHEWLVNYAGSERVLEQIVKLYPEADLFCQVDFLPDGERNYLPLMPFAVRRFDVSGYDFIISNSHSVAKGVKKKGEKRLSDKEPPQHQAKDSV